MSEKKICKRCGKLKPMMSWETTCYQCNKESWLEQQQEIIRNGDSDDADTGSDDYVICPYCGFAFEPCSGDDNDSDCFEEGDHEVTCGECDRTFNLNTTVSFYWETERIDEDGK